MHLGKNSRTEQDRTGRGGEAASDLGAEGSCAVRRHRASRSAWLQQGLGASSPETSLGQWSWTHLTLRITFRLLINAFLVILILCLSPRCSGCQEWLLFHETH